LFAPFLKIVFPKEAVEVSLEAAGEVETEFQGWIVLVVFNHVDGLSRDTDIFGELELGNAQFLAEFFHTIHRVSFLICRIYLTILYSFGDEMSSIYDIFLRIIFEET
jgi:hypothetical protein